MLIKLQTFPEILFAGPDFIRSFSLYVVMRARALRWGRSRVNDRKIIYQAPFFSGRTAKYADDWNDMMKGTKNQKGSSLLWWQIVTRMLNEWYKTQLPFFSLKAGFPQLQIWLATYMATDMKKRKINDITLISSWGF